MGKELAGWLHSESCGQRLHAQVEISDESCPSGVSMGPALFNIFVSDMDGRLSALSARLLMTLSCVARSTRWREGMPSRGTCTGLRAGPMQTS